MNKVQKSAKDEKKKVFEKKILANGKIFTCFKNYLAYFPFLQWQTERRGGRLPVSKQASRDEYVGRGPHFVLLDHLYFDRLALCRHHRVPEVQGRREEDRQG